MGLPTTESIREALADSWRAEQPATTIVLARHLLRSEPESGWNWARLGFALGNTANYHEAEEALKTALKVSPESKQHIIYGYLGHFCKQRGDNEGAIKWYQLYIDKMPDDASGYIFLGCVLAVQGRLVEAEATHRFAVTRKEGCIDEAYHNLGLVLRAQGRLEEAADCFEKAVTHDPKYDDAKEALADVRAAIAYQKDFE
jgi:tetratricopeptide (TPR) repeat protein